MTTEQIKKIKELQLEIDECNESCDIIIQSHFGKDLPKDLEESYKKFRNKQEKNQKTMREIILSL